MTALISIVTFLIILIVLVIAHELGHFLTAKSRGVAVLEFGLGFPPRIWGIKRGETLYSINALPLGGFVKLAGEEDPRITRSLASKGYGTRILVLSAGSIMNILLPLVLFSIAFMVPHSIQTFPVTIKSVVEGSPAAIAGIQAGDQVISVNGNEIENSGDLQRYIQLNLGKEIAMTLKSADATVKTIKVTPRWRTPSGQGATGIEIAAPSEQSIVTVRRSEPFWRAIPKGVTECWQTLVLFKNEIIKWVTGTTAPQVTGPVGMAYMSGQVAKSGLSTLFEFAAFISINLGIVNILPLPALDGGRIAFVLLEMVRRGKRITPKTEGLVHLVGFALLIGLMVLVTFGDIANFVRNGNPLP
jgi:regulator of sigma E protease